MTRVVHVVRSDGFAGVEGFIARLATEQVGGTLGVSVIGGEVSRMRGALGPTVHHPDETVLGVVRSLLRAAPAAGCAQRPQAIAELAATVAAALRRWELAPRSSQRVTSPDVVGRARRLSVHSWLPSLARHRVVARIAVSRFVGAEVGGESDVVRTGCRTARCRMVPRSRTVLVVQRLRPEKRTTDALRVFAESGVAHRSWRLQVAGDGVDRGAVVSLAAELGIAASTDLLGRRDDVPTLMSQAGICSPPRLGGPRPGCRRGNGRWARHPQRGSVSTWRPSRSIPEGQLYMTSPTPPSGWAPLADDEGGRAAYRGGLWAGANARSSPWRGRPRRPGGLSAYWARS